MNGPQGDIVNVLGLDEEVNKDWVIDDMNGLLVVNPDMLISGTSIVSTLFCMRKAVLNERFKVCITSFYNWRGFSSFNFSCMFLNPNIFSNLNLCLFLFIIYEKPPGKS